MGQYAAQPELKPLSLTPVRAVIAGMTSLVCIKRPSALPLQNNWRDSSPFSWPATGDLARLPTKDPNEVCDKSLDHRSRKVSEDRPYERSALFTVQRDLDGVVWWCGQEPRAGPVEPAGRGEHAPVGVEAGARDERERSDMRNKALPPMSLYFPGSPIGVEMATAAAERVGSGFTGAMRAIASVGTLSGAIVLTRIASGASSTANSGRSSLPQLSCPRRRRSSVQPGGPRRR